MLSWKKLIMRCHRRLIVGGGCGSLHYASGSLRNVAALALVFAEDKNKPPGPTGSSALDIKTVLTARREGSLENLDVSTLLDQVNEERGHWVDTRDIFIGVMRRRECSVGQEKVEWVTSLAFRHVLDGDQESLIVNGIGIKNGDTFRLYCPDSAPAISSAANATAYLRSFKQGDKREVFGGFIFSSWGRGVRFFNQPNVDSSLFRDTFPGVTLGGLFSVMEIGRGYSTPYVEESQEQSSARCCVHECSDLYLIMSYTS